ncbi:retrovirus-related pol polyprotein from transposon TNT 1-94 [Tanacetum coccineum]
MNEMIINNLTVATMQVNVQFFQQLQPEWSRFVTIVKQQLKLDEVSYHKLFDILKQYQKEVNELRAERIAKNANPVALVATCILVGYSTQSKGYRIYNKRTRLIVESIHLRFDEIKEMSKTSVANDTSGLVPQRQKASSAPKTIKLQVGTSFKTRRNQKTSSALEVLWKTSFLLYLYMIGTLSPTTIAHQHGPLIWPTIKENRVIRTKKYVELSATEKIQADCDMKATSITIQGDDPIACLNKAMAFLTAVASSRFPSTNNQLRTSSNLRNQVTIQDGRVTVQQDQGRQGQSYSGIGYKGNATSSRGNNASGQARVIKCYNCQGEGHMARQCNQPKRPRNAAWFKG